MPKVRLAMAQTNPTVGDIHNNIANCLQVVKAAAANGAQLVVFPEMSATGYPIEDLASRRSFIESSEAAIETFASQLSIDGYGEIAVVIGHP